jgi:hypothetical protein
MVELTAEWSFKVAEGATLNDLLMLTPEQMRRIEPHFPRRTGFLR